MHLHNDAITAEDQDQMYMQDYISRNHPNTKYDFQVFQSKGGNVVKNAASISIEQQKFEIMRQFQEQTNFNLDELTSREGSPYVFQAQGMEKVGMSFNLGQKTAEKRGRGNSDLSPVANLKAVSDLKAMISRNNEAIKMDSESPALMSQATNLNQSRYKKGKGNQQVLKPNVTNINASADEEKLLKDESRFGKNFSILSSKVMQMQSNKIKIQKGRNNKLRTTNQSMVGTYGKNMQFVLDNTLNSSDYNIGQNIAVRKSYDFDRSLKLKNQQFMNEDTLNDSVNFVHFAGFGSDKKDQKQMQATKSLGQQFLAQNSYKRMPVAQTFNLKQKMLSKFQNRINLEGQGSKWDNWSPIKKNNMELSTEKLQKGHLQKSQSRFNNNSQNEYSLNSNNSKSRVFQTQNNGFQIPHQYQYQKMMQEQQLSVGQAQIDNMDAQTTPKDIERISKLINAPSRKTGINFQSKKFVGLQGMPLGSGKELNAFKYEHNLGFTGSISVGHDTASETASGGPSGVEAIQRCTQNSQSSQEQITPLGQKNQSSKFGITNGSNFEQKSQEFKSKFESSSKMQIKEITSLVKFPKINTLEKQVHHFNLASKETRQVPQLTNFQRNSTQSPFDQSKVSARDLEITAQPSVSYKEMSSIESSTKQPNSPHSGIDNGHQKSGNQQSGIKISEEQFQGSRILQSIGSVQQHEFVPQNFNEEQSKFKFGSTVINQNKTQLNQQESPIIGIETAKISRNQNLVMHYRSFQGVDKESGQVSVDSKTRKLTNQSPLLSQNRNQDYSALKQISIDDVTGKFVSGYDYDPTSESVITSKRAILNKAKILLSNQDLYHKERKFPGGVKSYIPKSLSPLKNANRGSHIDQTDLQNAFSRFQDKGRHQISKAENVISSQSQIQAQVNKILKENEENDHGKKTGSSGFIQMGGIIHGYGSPYEKPKRKPNPLQKELDKALGTAIEFLDQASVNPQFSLNIEKRKSQVSIEQEATLEQYTKSQKDKFISSKKEPELHEMTYEQKKAYIEDQVLQGSSEYEYLMQFAQNKINRDTKAHVDRIESQRKMDEARALAIAKRDPLFDYYQDLKENKCGALNSKEGQTSKKERKIPGVSTEPLILPQVSDPSNTNAELELANSPNQVTKFLKNYKCKQMHSMMLQNRIPKGTSSVVRRSMKCNFKDCDHKIRNGEPYISCLKCGVYYCHKHIGIRKIDDLDDLRQRLGFINKKLQLENQIAALIIIIQEEKEKKREEAQNIEPPSQFTSQQVSAVTGQKPSDLNNKEPKLFKFKPKFQFKTQESSNSDQFGDELVELQQKLEEELAQIPNDDDNDNAIHEQMRRSDTNAIKEIIKSYKIESGKDQEFRILREPTNKDHLSPVDEEGSFQNQTPEPKELSHQKKPKLMGSPQSLQMNPFKNQHTLSSPKEEPNAYQKRKKQLLLQRIECKQKELALKDRKIQADLRRSPIQRETNKYLQNLNEKIDKIDVNDALQAHEQRKAAGRNKYISSDKKKEPSKGQFLNIQETTFSQRKSSQASQTSQSKNLMRGQRAGMSITQQQFLTSQTESVSSYEQTSFKGSQRRKSQDNWIQLDLLNGADPTKNDEIGTIQEQVKNLKKAINQKFDLHKELKESEAYKKAQLKKQSGKYSIQNFLSAQDQKTLDDPDVSKFQKEGIMARAEDAKQQQIKNDQRLKEEKKLAQIDAGGGMSSAQIMNLMGDDQIVDRYSKHLNKILFKFCDPFIKKKFDAYLELVEPSQQKNFFKRMNMDKQARDRKLRTEEINAELAKVKQASGGQAYKNNTPQIQISGIDQNIA